MVISSTTSTSYYHFAIYKWIYKSKQTSVKIILKIEAWE